MDLNRETLARMLGPDFGVSREERDFIESAVPSGDAQAVIEHLFDARLTIWIFEGMQSGFVEFARIENGKPSYRLSQAGLKRAEGLVREWKKNDATENN